MASQIRGGHCVPSKPVADTKLSGAMEMLEAASLKDLPRLEKQADGNLIKFCQVLPLGQSNSLE